MPVSQDLTVVLTEMACGSDRRVLLERATIMPAEFPWPEWEDPAYPWLSTIDAYGHTYFSQDQMRRVIPELEALRGALGDNNEYLSHLDSVLALAKKCQRGHGHEFLTFHGD